jgi:hypothetical protein
MIQPTGMTAAAGQVRALTAIADGIVFAVVGLTKQPMPGARRVS